MKKVLFTIQWFGIPARLAASANALCDEIIIRKLQLSQKYEIHVLSYGLPGYPQEEIINNIHVHRFKRSALWNKFIYTRNSKASLSGKIIYIINRIMMRIKQVLFFFSFPNYEPLHVRRFSNKAVELHKKYNFDLIISEFNGVDSLKAGLAVKRKDAQTLFIPICWDSISGGRLVKWMPEKMCRFLRRRLESQVMSLADKAIVMNSSMRFHELHTSALPYYRKFTYLDVPYLDVPDSIKNCGIENHIDLTKPLKLLYSGTMGDRYPNYLLKVLENTGLHSEIIFITLTQDHARLLASQKEYSNVVIKCLPYMSHSELSKYQLDSDILINFGVSNENAVSGKIFDYMRLGKPIISTLNHDNEACAPYLKKYPIALIIDERCSIKDNSQKLLLFISTVNKSILHMTGVTSTFKMNTPDAYVTEISGLLRDE